MDEKEDGKYAPRSVFTDLEMGAIDSIQNGPRRDIFHKDQFITTAGDPAVTYTSGFSEAASEQVIERVRKMAEGCESLEGFILYSGMGGGTGSGLGSLLLQ